MSRARLSSLLLLLLPALAGALGLAYIIRNSVRSAIIVPLTYLFWVGNLLIRSTPQVLFWGVLLALGFVFAIKSLGTPKQTRMRIIETQSRLPRRERLGFWMLQIRLAQWRNSMIRFSDFFGRLIIDVMAFREQMTPAQLERSLSEQPDLPEEVWAFLHARHAPLPMVGGFFSNWRERILDWRKIFEHRRLLTPTTPVLDNLERAVQFLEEELEIVHES